MILQKYVAAINSIVIVVLSALLAIPSGQLNFTSGAQIAAIGLSGVSLYLLPLLNVKWRGVLKTGSALVGAGIAAGFPIFQTVVDGQPFKPIYIALIVLSVAHALGTQVGVDIRTDTAALIEQAPVPIEVSADQVVVSRSDVYPYAPPTPDPYFAAGAGYQDPTVATPTVTEAPEYAPYSQAPAYNGADTATLSAVNPANQEDDLQ